VDREIDAALVLNDDCRAVGVLSQSDILLAVNAGVDTPPVREVMSLGVIAVRQDGTVNQASVLMIRFMVHRVFVVDEKGVPVGVVSSTDLIWALKVLWCERTRAPAVRRPSKPCREQTTRGGLHDDRTSTTA
jgi:predicted transcriptional regulator